MAAHIGSAAHFAQRIFDAGGKKQVRLRGGQTQVSRLGQRQKLGIPPTPYQPRSSSYPPGTRAAGVTSRRQELQVAGMLRTNEHLCWAAAARSGNLDGPECAPSAKYRASIPYLAIPNQLTGQPWFVSGVTKHKASEEYCFGLRPARGFAGGITETSETGQRSRPRSSEHRNYIT